MARKLIDKLKIGVTRFSPPTNNNKCLAGQWHGPYTVETVSAGLIVIDIDSTSYGYSGHALLYSVDPKTPRTWLGFSISNESDNHTLELPLNYLNGFNLAFMPPEKVAQQLGIEKVPTTAKATLSLEKDNLKLEWVTDIGTCGSAQLPRSRADQPSELQATQMIWEDFKKHVSKLEHRRFIFRGQERPWRLRTSFHRNGRADLELFLSKDFIALHRHLSAQTNNMFDLNIPDHRGGFMNLIQHHGYPTPLLDWTYSPFVAAFFAFRNGIRKQYKDNPNNERVRILQIDKINCDKALPPVTDLTKRCLHFSLMEFSAMGNLRLIPQQAISGVTNVDDIEDYIVGASKNSNLDILNAFDIDVRERDKVMKDLSTMGITAGSLFPGIDGACEELRERFFYGV